MILGSLSAKINAKVSHKIVSTLLQAMLGIEKIACQIGLGVVR